MPLHHEIARYRLLVAKVLGWHCYQLSIHLLSYYLVVERFAVTDARALGPGCVPLAPVAFAGIGGLHE